MSCEELKELLELHALGLLEGEEKSEMEAHLSRGCETCTRNLKEALAVNAAVLSVPSKASPPRRLRRRVLASVGVERSGWGWLGALATACMLAVALWLGIQERQRQKELDEARRTILEVRAERDRMQQALSFLNDPETQTVSFGKGKPAPPHGNVFVNGRSGVLLIASNLPPLAAGRIYEMWIIPKAGMPRPAGLFRSDASGSGWNILSGPVDLAALSAVAVTVEPESGSPGPTSTPVIAAPI